MREGLLLVDKPGGWTSHDVVAVVRGLAGTRRVGHAGTLDPMATGLLVLGIGRATRLLTYLVGADKAYTATIRLGEATVTDDAEGEVTRLADTAALNTEHVAGAVAALTGPIRQVPSAVSAIKTEGQRSYARVRAGEDVVLPPREVTVSRFDVLASRRAGSEGRRLLDLDVAVEVSSGTYVRALARDLGAALGVGGHLTALRRTRVGRFSLDQARPLAALQEQARACGPGIPLLSPAEAAQQSFPVRELSEEEAAAVGHGRRIASQAGTDLVAALDPAGRLVALLDQSAPLARAAVVFAPPA